MRNMNPTTIFSHLDVDDTLKGCCAEHGHLKADHVAAATSFTTDSTDHSVFPVQRFAIVLLVDGETAERGPQLSQQIVEALFDRFYRLMCQAMGEDNVQEALMMGMMANIVGLVDDDDEPTERGGLSDYRH